MSTVKIFKKGSPNGSVYCYLGQREFVSYDGKIDPIKGIAYVRDKRNALSGKFLYAQLVVTYRYGREEDETMGLSFKKEFIVDKKQVYPQVDKEDEENSTKLQRKMIQKLGEGAFPFSLNFPDVAPNSVLICADENENPADRTMGVFYDVRLTITNDSQDSVGIKHSAVSMAISKVQYTSEENPVRTPSNSVEKSFMSCGGKGKVFLETNMDKELYYHGQEIPVNISVNNQSGKSVKSIRCTVYQHAELTMLQGNQYSCKIAREESQDGCPIQAGSTLNKEKDMSNLAPSSLSETGNQDDLLGVVVSYSVKIKVIMSGIGGELEADLPFKLCHPLPGSDEMKKLNEQKGKANSQALRRRKFQQQDSVLRESLFASQAGTTATRNDEEEVEEEAGENWSNIFLAAIVISGVVISIFFTEIAYLVRLARK